MTSHQTPAGQLAPAPRNNLPNRILRAIDAALHIGALPRRLRPTLAELARYVSQALPFQPIFPHKAAIAKRTGASEETIYRHLAALKELGLIETLEQERKSRNGRFAVSRIRLTACGAALLGLVAVPDDPCALIATLEAPSSSEGVSVDEPVIHTPPTVNMPVGHTLTKPTYSKTQLPVRSTENGLPVDLACLSGKGVARAGIFKLMGIAKAHGKRLSDVVTVVEDRIRCLKGGHLFAYLSKLCAGPTDFSLRSASERARRAEADVERVYARKVAVFRERFAGVVLTTPIQDRVIAIDRDCRFAQVVRRSGATASTPMVEATVRAMIEDLQTGKLLLATRLIERQFGV